MTTALDLRIPIRIEVAPDGVHVTIEYDGTLASISQAIERLKQAGVVELVSGARHTAPLGNGKAKAERMQPTYNGAGEPCCPKHNRVLKEGQFGLYCSAKDDTTERGYCNLKFKD